MNNRYYRKRERILALFIVIANVLCLFFLHINSLNKITSPYLTLRNTPNANVALNYIAMQNEQYTLITTRDEWALIYTKNHVGWVEKDTLTQTNITPTAYMKPVKPIDNTVSAFRDPRSTEQEIGKLDSATTYYVYVERNNWSQIIYNDQIAWVETAKLMK